MCTEKQQRCIHAVCQELGIGVPHEEVKAMSVAEASAYIDQLKDRLRKPEEPIPAFNQWRFGMCTKLVLEHGIKLDSALRQPAEFVNILGRLYELVGRAEELFRNGQTGTELVPMDHSDIEVIDVRGERPCSSMY